MLQDPDPAPWRAHELRMTAFPSVGNQLLIVRDWWTSITGASPDKVTENPRTGNVQLHGTLEGTPLLMLVDPNRLDIRQRFETSRMPLFALPELGAVLSGFVKLAERWLKLDTRPKLSRLAFGAVAVQPALHLEDCRSVLDKYLPPIDMKKAGLTDFLYQVNRRRSSTAIKGLEVNRFTKWSVQQIQEVELQSASSAAISRQTFCSRLDVDINSDPEHAGILRANRLVPLFREFVTLAEQIVAKGDHP